MERVDNDSAGGATTLQGLTIASHLGHAEPGRQGGMEIPMPNIESLAREEFASLQAMSHAWSSRHPN